MSIFAIFAIVVLLLALFGFFFKLNGEVAGLSKNSRRGSFRSPHGRLVKTQRLTDPPAYTFASRFTRAIVAGGIPTVILLLLSVAHVVSLAAPFAASLDFILVVFLTVVLFQDDGGMWRRIAYGFVGYCLIGFGTTLLYLLIAGDASSTALANAITMIGGTVGCALGLAWMPVLFLYARMYEDGHVDTIQISSRSWVKKAFDTMEDVSWTPPESRVAGARAAWNPRGYRRDSLNDNVK